MTMSVTRRALMAGGAAAFSLSALAAPDRTMRVFLLGQCLIQHDLHGVEWPGAADFATLFSGADACFTDLETSIRGPNGGAVTRDPALLHLADPTAIDSLQTLHIDLLATANNHAFDVGTGGILDTISALHARGAVFAGTGNDLAAASAPGVVRSPKGTTALVAFATGKIREGGAATSSRAGVNEVRRDPSGELNEEDVARVIASIKAAARRCDVVLAYDHNHYWEKNIEDVPAWQTALAHRCIDAGAGCFVSHGAPVLQGIEIYKGRPIFYDLGNFMFQSPSHDNPYGPHLWQGLVAQLSIRNGRFAEAQLVPVVLNPVGFGGENDLVTRGLPQRATPEQADEILGRLAALSRPFGTRIASAGRFGLVVPAA
jgi:poly-gamma-glutamate capsule biosynthesis protein CapA/YwtB (metallophosphatase superfamily)